MILVRLVKSNELDLIDIHFQKIIEPLLLLYANIDEPIENSARVDILSPV
jgi:hypothetical protein